MGRCNGLRYVNRVKVVSQCSTAALELRDDSLITRTTPHGRKMRGNYTRAELKPVCSIMMFNVRYFQT